MTNLSTNSNIGIIIPSSFEMECLDAKKFFDKSAIIKSPGMGKVNTALEVADMSEYCNRIILGGFAGGLRGLSKGEIVTASYVIDGDFDARPLITEYPSALMCKSLHLSSIKNVYFISQDRFLSSDPYNEDLLAMKYYETLATDMESYAFVKACLKFGVEPYIVKVISDVVDGNAAKDFLASCKRLKGKMNESIALMLDEALSKRR